MDDASHFDLLEQRLVPQSGDGGTPLVSIERGFTERSNSRSNSRSNTAFFAAGQDAPALAAQPPQAEDVDAAREREQREPPPHGPSPSMHLCGRIFGDDTIFCPGLTRRVQEVEAGVGD